ncbi:hypothetical protein EYZ11_012919 [Aspergillus tanneri]|uniref:Uncharacterized protein n=1 Tax=Aspergillus tanneri TaxID=1220188 RepID=A0A4S3J153_9EURO|nr:hypothetical protein EYZ11_012919 [Aspergillus tanneri]
MGGPDPDGAERRSFQKRSRTLLGKAHDLAALRQARVYVVIDHPRATVVYNSVEGIQWPPSDENFESRYPDVHRLSFTDMERAREIPDTEELMCLLEYCKFRSKLLKGINRRVKKRQNPSAPDTFSHIHDHSND